MKNRGPLYGLASAALFGLSAPLSKLLLAGAPPLLFSGLLYLGAGVGLSLLELAVRRGKGSAEASVRRADLPLLAAVSTAAGLGPVFLLLGLTRVSAMTGSLLLNLEGPLTILIAVVLFREHLGRRTLLATVAVIGGAALLGLEPGEAKSDWPGVLALVTAALCWAIDNNLSSKLSLRDPIQVARLKTLLSGTVLTLLALALGMRPVSGVFVGEALGLGAACYGLSLLLYLQALRLLGAARQAAYFSSAPFVGALAAIPILGERPGPVHAVAALLMLGGLALLLGEKHSHAHRHEPLEHDHLHVHDEHHQHVHDGPVTEPHSHHHQHEPLSHEHPHLPDLHHRHGHE